MNKLGIIFTSYATENLTTQSLEPWLKQDDIKVSAVSFPFINFDKLDNSKNLEILRNLKEKYKDKFISLRTGDFHVTEEYARDKALQDILLFSDFCMILDSDEIYTIEEINKLRQYINDNGGFHPIMKIEFKNLFGDIHHFIENFNPARIWKKNILDVFSLTKCYYDNNFIYKNNITNEEFKDTDFLHHIIPKEILQPVHYSWNDPERSKRKVQYQEKHFGVCSFRWNNEKNKIEINENYYNKTGKEKPIIKELNEN